MPTLANTVIPMARYETVRIQIRRRGPANAGVTDRVRNDVLFRDTDPQRRAYKAPEKWPVNGFALSGLDAEIYRRVFARQRPDSKFRGEKFKTDILKQGVGGFAKLLGSAADVTTMKASMGTDIFTGNNDTMLTIQNEMAEGTQLNSAIMGYILRVYLGVGKYDRAVVVDPLIWHNTALGVSQAIDKGLPARPAKWWLSAEIFQYKIPAEALPLGTDASDRILLNLCGISLVLFVLNTEKFHWSLLAYPIRKDSTQRKLYHYDSTGRPSLQYTKYLTEQRHVRLVEGGLFSRDIFKYFANPTWGPQDLGCKQPEGWECGYMALGILDILCRKTEANPASMSNPSGGKPERWDPLQIRDIPKFPGISTSGSLAKYMNNFLSNAKEWANKVGKATVWQIQEPADSYADHRGAPDLLAAIRAEMEEQDILVRLAYFIRSRVSENQPAIKMTKPKGVCGLSRGVKQMKYNHWGSWDLGNENYLHCVFGVVGDSGPDSSPATAAAETFAEILRIKFNENNQTTATDSTAEKRGFKQVVQASITALDQEMFTSYVLSEGEEQRKNHLWYKNGLVCVCVLISNAWMHLFSVGSANGLVATRPSKLEIATNIANNDALGFFNKRMADATKSMEYPKINTPLPRNMLHTPRRLREHGKSTILLATTEIWSVGYTDREIMREFCAKFFPAKAFTFMILDATRPKKSKYFPIHLGAAAEKNTSFTLLTSTTTTNTSWKPFSWDDDDEDD